MTRPVGSTVPIEQQRHDHRIDDPVQQQAEFQPDPVERIEHGGSKQGRDQEQRGDAAGPWPDAPVMPGVQHGQHRERAAITSPNERSEPATIGSSRENASWVACVIFGRAGPSVIPKTSPKRAVTCARGRGSGSPILPLGELLCFAVRSGKPEKHSFR